MSKKMRKRMLAYSQLAVEVLQDALGALVTCNTDEMPHFWRKCASAIAADTSGPFMIAVLLPDVRERGMWTETPHPDIALEMADDALTDDKQIRMMTMELSAAGDSARRCMRSHYFHADMAWFYAEAL